VLSKQFQVLRPDGAIEFNLRPPTCVGGMCVDCLAEGCCRRPFYLYAPSGPQQQVARVTKLWAGVTNELFTNAHVLELEPPPLSTNDTKARLLAATFLVNQIFFQRNNQSGNAGVDHCVSGLLNAAW
jgi:hypothetical protein